MFKNYLLIFCAFISASNAFGQGILDSLSSENSPITAPEQVQVPAYSGYPYSAYLKDSTALVALADSLALQWSMHEKGTKKIRYPRLIFDREQNVELLKKIARPKGLTALFFIILILVSVKYSIFKGISLAELGSLRSKFAFEEWLSERPGYFNIYSILSRILSYSIYSICITYFIFLLKGSSNLTELFIQVLLFVILSALIKHIFYSIFGWLTQEKELFQRQFYSNHLIHSLLIPAVFILFCLAYFSSNNELKNWFSIFYMISFAIIYLLYLVLLYLQILVSPRFKKIYVIFYLCTLEILPVLVLFTWLANQYL